MNAEGGLSFPTRVAPITRRVGLRVALAGPLALAACGLSGAEGVPAESAKDVTISYVTDWNSGARGDWVKAATQKFTEENPKIKVQVDNWGGEVIVVALANAAAGTLQDVMLNANDVFISLVRAGGMKDLGPVLKSQRVNMNDVIGLPSTYTYQGKQYGMPFQFGANIMMLNKTLFRQSGATLPTDKTTYTELLEQLRKISRPEQNVYGMTVSGTPGGWNEWIHFVWAFGGDRWTPDQKKSLIDSPASIEGLQFFVDMMHRHRVVAPLDEKGAGPAGVGFFNGNVGVGYATSPGPGTDKQVAGKFEWDVMYHPMGVKVNKRNVPVNNQAHVVTAPAVKRGVFDQAVRFAVWVATSKTSQDLIVEIGPNTMPVLKSALASPKYLAGPPASMKIIHDQISAYRDPETFIGWNKWRDSVVAALLPAFSGKTTVQEAAREAARQGDLVLAAIPR
jgi:multiple sugar transport system substrate-binding protein